MSPLDPAKEFPHYYARKMLELKFEYEDYEFLYPHDQPWPERSFDHPFGMSPAVQNIPKQEHADWQKHIGDYYTDNALGSLDKGGTKTDLEEGTAGRTPSPFGVKAVNYALENLEKCGLAGYEPLTDQLFLKMLCEGLYSKFLGVLDEVDRGIFGKTDFDEANYQYLKSDYSCMKVIRKCWDDEHVAPTIVLVRRPTDNPAKKYVDQGAYEIVAIAIANKDANGEFQFTKDLVLTPSDPEHHSWRLAKYFVLQAAFHRINLVDHVKVHMPSDTINAVTKTILPRWHVVQQLLLPHFWLTLPVNHAVLESPRSLINRDTWYPWSPFVARGEEVRKLLPFHWAGSEYYWDGKNSSYPPYGFNLDPKELPFIALDVSRYSTFLRDYYAPVRTFAKSVVDQLPKDQTKSLAWLEIQRWAHHISTYIPGFPDQVAILDRDKLTNVLAMIVWNASIGHSSDHAAIHTMFEQHKPMATIIRVQPPTQDAADATESLWEAIPEQVRARMMGGMYRAMQAVLGSNQINVLEDLFAKILPDLLSADAQKALIEKVFKHVLQKHPTLKLALDWSGELAPLLEEVGKSMEQEVRDVMVKAKTRLLNQEESAFREFVEKAMKQLQLDDHVIPLCWPTDLLYQRMADLLFYMPHNSSLLYETQYLFEPMDEPPPPEPAGASPLTIDQQKQFLHDKERMLRLEDAWKALSPSRPLLTDDQKKSLQDARKVMRDAFVAINKRYYAGNESDEAKVAQEYGFPKLMPDLKDKDDVERVRREECIAAGIQY